MHIDADLTLDVIVDCDTLDEVVTAIAGATGAVGQPEPQPQPEPEPDPADPSDFPELVRMNAVAEGRPVFWVHHGNGGV
ncbi:hypothetical protein PSZ14_23200, partial [Shigella flexneri]|nr:hypothetical protein [Shigella flexneri]